MSRFPALTSRQVVAALKKAGYTEARQSGSHLTMRHPARPNVIVPMHARDVTRGTMMRILRQAGFSEDEFRSFL
jgi:predicted RNA binding protein YcfA (HicA-like mRNA interferase family)